MESILKAREGELLVRLIEDMTVACKSIGADDQKYATEDCIRKCKILSAMLESVEGSNCHLSFEKQKRQL